MEVLRIWRWYFFWWVVWVLACVPAGALAGAGFVEFNWGGPPYDGGFMGDLVLFGGSLALGQAPFVFFFVLRLCRGTERRPWTGYVVAVCSALLWTLMGFVGWTVGSYYEVGFETTLYSSLGVLAGIFPWLSLGALEGIVLMVILAAAWRLRRDVSGSRVRSRGFAGTLVVSGVAWALASSIGGLFYEYWASFDVAARQNRIKDAIGALLEGAGVAENVAFEVVTSALVIPIVYAVPTGLVFVVIRAASTWRFASTG